MNRGAELLAKSLASGEKQTTLAGRLGVDQGNLSRFVRGIRKPGLKTRTALRDEKGIPLDAWDQPPLGETEESPAAELVQRRERRDTGT